MAPPTPVPSAARPRARGRRGRARRAAASALVSALASALVGCGDDGPRTLPDARPRAPEAPPPRLGVAAVDRFGLAPPFRLDVPAAWREVPPAADAPGRVGTWRPEGRDDVEITLSAAGGDLAANVARWRGQLGLPSRPPEGVGALPRRPFLGREGVFLDLTGRFAPRAGAPVDDAAMLVLALPLQGTTFVLKAVGPRAVVEGERERFLGFGASARTWIVDPAAAGPSDGGDGPATGRAPDAEPGPYTWEAPPGWEPGPEKPLRLATFWVGGRRDVEVTVHRFGAVGDAVRLNVDRWRSQLGLPPATDAELAALPRVPMLGGEGVLVVLDGPLTDTMRGVEVADGRLVAAVVAHGDDLVFVKCTGPRAAVVAATDAVVAFCRTLKASG